MKENYNISTSTGGIGFFGAAELVLIVLKLTGVVDWAWWYIILAPLIVEVALSIGIIILAFIIGLIVSIFD